MHQGDTWPALQATLQDGNGNPVDLTLATSVVLTVVSRRTGLQLFQRVCTVTNATGGQVSYTWQAGDTATPDSYAGTFLVTFVGGVEQTYPSLGFVPIFVEA